MESDNPGTDHSAAEYSSDDEEQGSEDAHDGDPASHDNQHDGGSDARSSSAHAPSPSPPTSAQPPIREPTPEDDQQLPPPSDDILPQPVQPRLASPSIPPPAESSQNAILGIDKKGKLARLKVTPATDKDASLNKSGVGTGALKRLKKGRRTFGTVISKGEHPIYLDDLEYFSIKMLPSTCAVTDPRLQDPELKSTYKDRPNLP